MNTGPIITPPDAIGSTGYGFAPQISRPMPCTIIETPTQESAQQLFEHRGIRLLVVTGGPAVARAALASKRRAIVAGPGNPPVVVDATACIEGAARAIGLTGRGVGRVVAEVQ